jgi:hypothetical protein
MKKRQIRTEMGLIELLGQGQQTLVSGTHSSGARYEWAGGLPDSIPVLKQTAVDQLWMILTTKYAKSVPTPAARTAAAQPATETTEALRTISEADWQYLIECLRFLVPHAGDEELWARTGMALLSIKSCGKPVSQLWTDFSRKAPNWQEGAAESWWGAHANQEHRSDYRSVFKLARDRGMLRVASPDSFPPVQELDPLVDVVPPEVLQAGERTVIRLSEAGFSDIVKQLEEVLTPYAYTQGPHLTRTSEAHTDENVQRSADALMLIPATRGWARIKFGEICDFQRYISSQAEWRSVAPSVDHIHTLLDRGSWNILRPLDAIARSPYLRSDGTIGATEGYDPISRVLYIPSIDYPPILERPEYEDALAALARLREPFNEFPWKEQASESAFLSHILAEAARLAMSACPMYFYDAPLAGTGKSTLQEMAARIVHGTEPALRPWVPDEDELRKSLYACLIAGDRSIWFDNLPDGIKVRSSTLEGFITSAVWKDRKLGESTTTGIPNKTVLVASGNNLTPVSALARRSIVIRLDANTEHLRDRVFRIPNPRKYVMERRGQMLVDALTIIKTYLRSADDYGVTIPVTLPSFEEWSHLARNPLIWLGLADPVVTQKETDDEMRSIGPVFEKLIANFGEQTFTAGDMARIVGSLSDERNELSDALMQMGCTEPNNPVKVGYWLRASKDKIGSNWKLVHDRHNKFGVRWRLQRVNGDLTSGI